MKIRKLVTVVEEIQEDGGRSLDKPLRKVAAVAVIEVSNGFSMSCGSETLTAVTLTFGNAARASCS